MLGVVLLFAITAHTVDTMPVKRVDLIFHRGLYQKVELKADNTVIAVSIADNCMSYNDSLSIFTLRFWGNQPIYMLDAIGRSWGYTLPRRWIPHAVRLCNPETCTDWHYIDDNRFWIQIRELDND